MPCPLCPSGRGETYAIVRATVEQDHVPVVGGLVITQDVDAIIVSAHLEVAVVRIQPAVDDLHDRYFALAAQHPIPNPDALYLIGRKAYVSGQFLDAYDAWAMCQILPDYSEVVIPPKRITGMPKTTMIGLIGEDRFIGVYNFTPGQSVSIVDLEKRKFVGEIPTAGCAFLLPNGNNSFTSICSNGSMLTSHLDADGKLAGTTKTPVLFDAENDPIFEDAPVDPQLLSGIDDAHYSRFGCRLRNAVDEDIGCVSSRHAWDTTWTPIGIPSEPVPHRTTATGQPVKLNAAV